MNDQDLSASDSRDQPLFVLKYRSSIRAGLVFSFGFLIFFFWVFILILPAHSFMDKFFMKPFAGIISLPFLFQLIDLLLFKEFRLYRDRVVKVWKLLGSAEIRLANARLVGWGFSSLKVKYFSDHSRIPSHKWLQALCPSRPLRFVSYAEHYADPQDVEKLTKHLAELSGRKVEEFKAARIDMKRLIVEETDHG
jgi:hypothetical protein